MEALASHDVAANFSLRVFNMFNAFQTQAEACGYRNRTFARAFIGKKIRSNTLSPAHSAKGRIL